MTATRDRDAGLSHRTATARTNGRTNGRGQYVQESLFLSRPVDDVPTSSTGTTACHVPGCSNRHARGKGRVYCDELHQCDYDGCRRLVVDRHRCRLHAYCRAEGCTDTRRPVSAARYCERHATSIDYEDQRARPSTAEGPCVVCGATVVQRVQYGRPLLLCDTHRRLRSTLKDWRRKYGLTDERIAELLDDPHCWVCAGDLGWFVHSTWTTGTKLDPIHVDHDHGCCRGSTSCGGCVRGLTHARCNRRLGFLEPLVAELGIARVVTLVTQLGTSYDPRMTQHTPEEPDPVAPGEPDEPTPEEPET